MHKLTIGLVEHLADLLQTGRSSPNYNLTVYRQKDGGYESYPFVLQEVTRITIDRRWSMAADEISVEMANTNGHYSPDYSINKSYTGVKDLPLSGYNGVIHAYNKVTCDLGYGDQLVRMFTGQIQNIDIGESPPTIKFNALNAYRKLLKPIDPITHKSLVYENEPAFAIVIDLCKRAGIDEIEFDTDKKDLPDSDEDEDNSDEDENDSGEDDSDEDNSNEDEDDSDEDENNSDEDEEDSGEGDLDFGILDKIEFELGMDYSEAIKSILKIMNHRIIGDRYGRIKVLRNEIYSQKDFHNWEFDDCVNLTESTYKIDVSFIRNRVIIQSNNGWQAFEDPFLVDYCNGEIISAGIESPWAETLEEKWAVADNFFLTMRRKLRRISVVVPGNPAMDIGDLVKTSILTSTANAKYMIIAIQSDFSSKGYIDQVDLEYVDINNGHLCQPAEGAYESREEEVEEEPETAPVVMTLRDRIVDYAKSFYGKPYQWGGDLVGNPKHYGFDCSHFTFRVLNNFGLMDSYLQARYQKEWCHLISREELLPGDLVFYKGADGIVGHVVMYIGNGQIIGANGGDGRTVTKEIADNKKAMVKVDEINYRWPAFFGRAPRLV